jgi:phytoene dehydrogenase-like protein
MAWPPPSFSGFTVRSARAVADSRFTGVRARALFAGLAAHSFLPLESPVSAAFGLVLGIAAHTVGWPIPQAGHNPSQMRS